MRMVPTLLVCSLAVLRPAYAHQDRNGGELLCTQQLERTANYFRARRGSLDPQVARSIENDLRVYEVQCHAPNNTVIAARLDDIRRVIDGHATAEILPNPPRLR